jgi:hypothetical protein
MNHSKVFMSIVCALFLSGCAPQVHKIQTQHSIIGIADTTEYKSPEVRVGKMRGLLDGWIYADYSLTTTKVKKTKKMAAGSYSKLAFDIQYQGITPLYFHSWADESDRVEELNKSDSFIDGCNRYGCYIREIVSISLSDKALKEMSYKNARITLRSKRGGVFEITIPKTYVMKHLEGITDIEKNQAPQGH